MSPVTIALVLGALVAVTTLIGLVWRARTGRLRSASASLRVDLPEVPRGSRATLLQFSTGVCAPCVPTRALLSALADDIEGVRHVDLDIGARPELASRFGILQTPTTFVLDRRGTVVARIGGAPRPEALRAGLARAVELA